MECPFCGEGGVWLKGTETDIWEGVKNVHFTGDILNGRPFKGELSYAHGPQLGSQIHCSIGNQIRGPLWKENVCHNFALTVNKFVFSYWGNLRAKANPPKPRSCPKCPSGQWLGPTSSADWAVRALCDAEMHLNQWLKGKKVIRNFGGWKANFFLKSWNCASFLKQGKIWNRGECIVASGGWTPLKWVSTALVPYDLASTLQVLQPVCPNNEDLHHAEKLIKSLTPPWVVTTSFHPSWTPYKPE